MNAIYVEVVSEWELVESWELQIWGIILIIVSHDCSFFPLELEHGVAKLYSHIFQM